MTLQAAAIPAVGSGDVLLASHTGSGKTLAYLLPLVSCRTVHTAHSLWLRLMLWEAVCQQLWMKTKTACMQIEKLKQQEEQLGLSGKPKRPRAMVLGPTRELTDQILRVAKGLSHHAKFRAVCVNGGRRPAFLQAGSLVQTCMSACCCLLITLTQPCFFGKLGC